MSPSAMMNRAVEVRINIKSTAMEHPVKITIENRLTAGERDINVYHHSGRSAHLISHHSSLTLPLLIPVKNETRGSETAGGSQTDYFQVSVSRGPGYLWNGCVIEIPSWLDFIFSSRGKLNINRSPDGKYTFLKIPPGPPTWEIKLAASEGALRLSGGATIRIKDDCPEDNEVQP